jgi:hypothetical protein
MDCECSGRCAHCRYKEQAKMLMKKSERRRDIASAKTILFWAFGRDPH